MGKWNPCLITWGRRGVVFAFLALAFLCLPGQPSWAAVSLVAQANIAMPAKIICISQTPDGSPANGDSISPALSQDGRYIAFTSGASNLVPEDTNAAYDIFLHDVVTRQTVRVSVTQDGAQANGSSFDPAVSADGRYVAFASGAGNLIPGDTNSHWDIFVKDVQTGQVSRVSVHSNGAQANGDSSDPSISADGRYILFTSDAYNLIGRDVDGDGICEFVEGCDTNLKPDIYVHDRLRRLTQRISLTSTGAEITGSLGYTFLSADGRYASFYSTDAHIDPADINWDEDIFIMDRQRRQTSLVSYTYDGLPQDETGPITSPPFISADGRYVVYESYASNVIPNDTNDAVDVFRYDRQTGETTRLSLYTDGAQISGISGDPALSADGRFVAFFSSGHLTASDETPYLDVFVRDLQTGQYSHASLTDTGEQVWRGAQYRNLVLTASGTYLAYSSDIDLAAGSSTYWDIYLTPTLPIFVVNSSGDASDQTLADNLCATGQTTPAGEAECTLRAAIQQANNQPGSAQIQFNIPSTGDPVIQPHSGLPTITSPVIIDGGTQPGGRVVLDGGLVPLDSGLHITAGNSTVRDLVIRRFGGHGLWLQTGGGNRVEHCWIGLNPQGAEDVGNDGYGILIDNSPENVIGGAAQTSRNLIAANLQGGIGIQGMDATGNQVQGNWIGLAADGVTALGNYSHGIEIVDASSITVGGAWPGAGNQIAHNRGAGIDLSGSEDPTPGANSFLGNAIFANQALGIDLRLTAAGEPNPNDLLDNDDGPNGLQNFPALTVQVTNQPIVTATLESQPNTSYRVEFFANDACDPSGYGEGQEYIGVVEATTDAAGTAVFQFPTTEHFTRPLTLTATDPQGNTSEFSPCRSLALETPVFDHYEFPNKAWVQVPPGGTVDGNLVRIRTRLHNRGSQIENPQVLFLDAETGRLLPDGMKTVQLLPGQTLDYEFIWDTEGYAWQEGTPRAHLAPRQIEVRLRDLPAYTAEVLFDRRTETIQVSPKPLVLVHGWNTNAAATWSAYPGFAHRVHPDWVVRAVDSLETGNPFDFGKSLWVNASRLQTFIDNLRAELNAWHVELIAHSKGGLVSRTYINSYMAPVEVDGKPAASHLVMLGTPNRGSPCAELIPGDGAYELSYAFVNDIFNRLVTDRKGVPFSILAGVPLPFTCQETRQGDGVVELVSAWGLNSTAYVADMEKSLELHTEMTTSGGEFDAYVVPRITLPATGQAALASLDIPTDTLGLTAPQLILARNVSIPVGLPSLLVFQVTDGITLGVTLAASEVISASLHAPDGALMNRLPSGEAQARQPFRTMRIVRPVYGAWVLRLENRASSGATEAAVSVWLGGAAVQLDLQVGQVDVGSRLPLSLTVTQNGVPLPGAQVTATFTSTAQAPLTLALYDDGWHGDGQAADGVYAATAGPLLPGAYVILGRATAPGLDRLTTASAWIVETDLDLALTASSQTVRPDDLLTYTFTITNQGPSDAYSLALSTTLPSTMQFVSLQATRSGCTLAGRLVTCSLGLGSAEQAEVCLVVRPTLPGLLTLTAQVSTLERELVLENNIRSLSVMVSPRQCFLPLLQR